MQNKGNQSEIFLILISSLQAGNAEHAFEDIKRYIDEAVDGTIISYWVLSE